MSIGASDRPFEVDGRRCRGRRQRGRACPGAAGRRRHRARGRRPSRASAASGTNSGILHTGFDSVPGELETELILRSAQLRDPVLDSARRARAALRRGDAAATCRRRRPRNAGRAERRRGARCRDDGALSVPGETVTDPVAYTLALAAAAERHGARTFADVAVDDGSSETERAATVGVVVNCAGPARRRGRARCSATSRSRSTRARASSWCSTAPASRSTASCCRCRPSAPRVCWCSRPSTAHVVAGPTAVDGDDKEDWSVRPRGARRDLAARRSRCGRRSRALEPIAAYAGLRPAGATGSTT